MTKFAAYLIENKHSKGRIGDIMEILHVTNKGRPIDAIKMYHLNKETKQFNQINDKHPETEQNIRFRTLGKADRTHTHTLSEPRDSDKEPISQYPAVHAHRTRHTLLHQRK
jgi:hypothetical protein